MNKEIEEVLVTSPEINTDVPVDSFINPFDKVAQKLQSKQDALLAEDLMRSGMLYTKKGRELLGIKLKPYKKEYPKIGRNEKCFCGSNLKYKKCCGAI